MSSFCDQVILHVKAGNGGNGTIGFRHEMYAPRGGPDGGDGGTGGDVILRVNPNLNTLSFLRRKPMFKAGNGDGGGSQQSHGKNGKELILEVPEGTVVSDALTGKPIMDLMHEGETVVIARGGRGGFGNAHFISSTRQAPSFAEKGEMGEERKIKLELKLVADVAIIGLPSVGKSTLISRISNAKPKIADYPFTTLIPNLGVVNVDDMDFVVADIPGLIEGAHQGKGLGHEFLRHTERSRVIVHLLDVTSTNIKVDFETIQNELKRYSETLASKQQVVALNKIDALGEDLISDMQRNVEKEIGVRVYPVSCVSGYGLKELLYAIVDLLKKEQHEEQEAASQNRETSADEYKVFRPHLDHDERSFHVERKHGQFYVRGKRIEQIVAMTDFSNSQAMERVYDVFEKMGIRRELMRLGCKMGDTVRIGEYEVEFNG